MAISLKNYAELAAAVDDIHSTDYAAFYTPFGANVAQPAPATLRDHVLNASNTYPKVFVKTSTVGQQTRISCLVRPTRFYAPLGRTSTHAGSIHCLNGDISSQGLPSIATWPAQAFARVNPALVSTIAELDALLQATAGLEFIQPYAAGAANTETVQCRNVCPLPSTYAALVLQRPHFSPREFWEIVIHQVIIDGHAATCGALIDWARMAIHHVTTPAGITVAANSSDPLVAPLADIELLEHVSSWIQVDLPDRAPAASAVGVQQQLLVQQQILTTLVANQQQATVAAGQTRRKTVGETFPTFLPMLLRYANAINEATLPPSTS